MRDPHIGVVIVPVEKSAAQAYLFDRHDVAMHHRPPVSGVMPESWFRVNSHSRETVYVSQT
jgi:hypothetical protein